MPISKTPQARFSADGLMMKMVFPSDGELVIKPTLQLRLLRLLFLPFLVLGLATLIVLVPRAVVERSVVCVVGMAICLPLGLLFIGIGLGGFFLGLRYCRADRAMQTVTLRRGSEEFLRKTILPFSRIAAIQLCSKEIATDDGGYVALEINLVLADEDDQRVFLYAHSQEQMIRDQARHLAEFLGKPLLDHTSPKRRA